jgi:hypothetical protein
MQEPANNFDKPSAEPIAFVNSDTLSFCIAASYGQLCHDPQSLRIAKSFFAFSCHERHKLSSQIVVYDSPHELCAPRRLSKLLRQLQDLFIASSLNAASRHQCHSPPSIKSRPY